MIGVWLIFLEMFLWSSFQEMDGGMRWGDNGTGTVSSIGLGQLHLFFGFRKGTSAKAV